MKIWFDTEFYENGSTIRLISIGIVREDGATYYAESHQAEHYCNQDSWLIENVLPHLKGESVARYRPEIRKEVQDFVGNNPEFWAYYCSYDWIALCQLFGRMIDLPKGWPMYCRDVQQEVDRLGATLPKQDTTEHHALADALWTKQAWDYLQMCERLYPALVAQK